MGSTGMESVKDPKKTARQDMISRTGLYVYDSAMALSERRRRGCLSDLFFFFSDGFMEYME